MTDPIARFYDAHPYPPPVADLSSVAARWHDGQLRRIEHARTWPTLPYRDDLDILVAGCGTSQAAKYAVRYPNARVVGIDVSSASLEHTRQLATQHGIDNLELRQLPIEEVHRLDSRFDQIVCTGVLHHLEQPEVGMRALRESLAPTGALRIMLYAPYGRTGVYMIQEYCRLLGIRPAETEIRELIQSLRELPLGHPLGHLLRDTPDFRDDDALADALLNPRDRAYSVPAIFSQLDGAGLRFGRWLRQAAYVPQTGVLDSLPHGRRIAALPIEEQYRALELFRGTMTRHSLIAFRDDGPDGSLVFDDPRVDDYVPIRVTIAIAVEDGLPAGARAALLNRSHTYNDLVMLVDQPELDAFAAIDGRHSIGELAHADSQFYESLWWRDLIVVDASSG